MKSALIAQVMVYFVIKESWLSLPIESMHWTEIAFNEKLSAFNYSAGFVSELDPESHLVEGAVASIYPH